MGRRNPRVAQAAESKRRAAKQEETSSLKTGEKEYAGIIQATVKPVYYLFPRPCDVEFPKHVDVFGNFFVP